MGLPENSLGKQNSSINLFTKARCCSVFRQEIKREIRAGEMAQQVKEQPPNVMT